MKLSKLTATYSAYIIISSFFMRRAWEIWEAYFGLNLLNALVVLYCLSLTLLILSYAVSLKEAGVTAVICVAILAFSLVQPYISERAHVLQFGLLGWLAVRDMQRQDYSWLRNAFFTLVFVTIIGVSEELYQKFLPWRVCDPRDMLTDIVAGGLGMLLYLCRQP